MCVCASLSTYVTIIIAFFQADGTYTPRIKVYNGREYDIANLTFRKLPPKMQYENLISTKILCDSVVKHRNQKKGEFTHSFMEETARKLHEAWRNRNVLKAKAAGDAEKKKDDSQIPYKKLSDAGSHLPITTTLPTSSRIVQPCAPICLPNYLRVFRKSESTKFREACCRYLQ